MGLAEGATPRPWVKFYPVHIRFTISAYRHRKRLIISYPGNDFDFESTIIERAKRMGYPYYRPEYSFTSSGEMVVKLVAKGRGFRNLVFER